VRKSLLAVTPTQQQLMALILAYNQLLALIMDLQQHLPPYFLESSSSQWGSSYIQRPDHWIMGSRGV